MLVLVEAAFSFSISVAMLLRAAPSLASRRRCVPISESVNFAV